MHVFLWAMRVSYLVSSAVWLIEYLLAGWLLKCILCVIFSGGCRQMSGSQHWNSRRGGETNPGLLWRAAGSGEGSRAAERAAGDGFGSFVRGKQLRREYFKPVFRWISEVAYVPMWELYFLCFLSEAGEQDQTWGTFGCFSPQTCGAGEGTEHRLQPLKRPKSGKEPN